MKTPREVLLARHAQAEGQLARVTDEVIAGLCHAEAPQITRAAQWLDWLWPSPVAWGSLAAAWLVILALNGGTLDLFNPPILARAERSPETEHALQEQRRLLIEMVGATVEETLRPGPHSSIPAPLENA